jgi:hypothetical protein
MGSGLSESASLSFANAPCSICEIRPSVRFKTLPISLSVRPLTADKTPTQPPLTFHAVLGSGGELAIAELEVAL